MNPRLRTFVFLLTLAFLAVPAPAFALPCAPNLGLYDLGLVDTTAPSAAWQKGSPVGTVDIPLTGSGVLWQWKVDCGPLTDATSPAAATITGDGAHRFAHRAQETLFGNWTDWVDSWVQIDSTVPLNTTVPPTTAWSRGAVPVAVIGIDDAAHVPVTGAVAASPVHTEWRVDGAATSAPWVIGGSASVDGTGTHLLETAAVDEAGNRAERTDTVNIDNTLPDDDTTTPSGWQPAAVDVDVKGTDAHSGVGHVEWQLGAETPGSGPSGTTVRIAAQGKHIFKTRVVDAVGNASAWAPHEVWVDIQGPQDTTDVPSTWFTTPSTVISVKGADDASGVKLVEWRLDNLTNGQGATNQDTVPVPVSGDGVHKLEVRVTPNVGQVSQWSSHDVKIDTVTPIDTTAVASGWLRFASLDVNVMGTDVHSLVEHVEYRLEGGIPGSSSGDSHVVTVAGNGTHTLETRVVDNAGLRSAWKSHTILLDVAAPTNLTLVGDPAWRNTPYSIVLDGSDPDSGVDSVIWRIGAAGVEHVGTAGLETARITTDGTSTLETRVRDVAGSYSPWRQDAINIDRVPPTDDTVYPSPSAPVPNHHLITFVPNDDRSRVAGIEWTLDADPAVKTAATATITGAGAHTLTMRVKDNAGNWSAWTSHDVTVNLALDTSDPTDTTVVPSNWRTTAYTVVVTAVDEIDGTGVDYVEWRFDNNPVGSGPSGNAVPVTTDGVHEFETRATDKAGHVSGWRKQILRIDTAKPSDTTTLPAGWTNSRTFTLSATDATSTVASVEYKYKNKNVVGAIEVSGVSLTVPATVVLPADGAYTISHRALDVAGQSSGWKVDDYSVETVIPVNTSAAAPTSWQTSALSLPLTGTDVGGSGVDHAEWRVGPVHGEVPPGSTADVSTEGIQTLETRIVDKAGNASVWRLETVKVDHTPPTNTTPAPSTVWRQTSYTATVSGTDAVSGPPTVAWRLEGGAVATTPIVTISSAGLHKLETRVIDGAGNASPWRTDSIGIDKTVPTLTVDCGTILWRSTPPVCSVVAGGGESGLPTLTEARGTDAPVPVAGGSYTFDAEGAATINFRAVDGAGNETLAHADVKVDRTPPAAAVTCVEGAGTSWVCTGSGTDALSRVSSLSYSVDGSAAAAVGGDGSFVVQKGTVVVQAIDGAGNTGTSAPVTLADRTPPPPPAPAPVATPTPTPPAAAVAPTPRVTTEAVLLRGGGSASGRLVGQLSISATPTRTTVDLRPLALGKGRFQFALKVTAGKKTTIVRRTQTTKSGYSQRISMRVPTAARATVGLTVRRNSGGRWVTAASGSAALG